MDLQLFTGDANEALARVYASLPRAGLPADARITGQLVGPYCRYSHTLPARIPFVDRGPGETLLAEAVVPDPCFWTPELPFMYTAELRLDFGGAQTETAGPILQRRPFGIRRLGVQGTSIYLDAKRFVLRGVKRDDAQISDLKAARRAASALYVSRPSAEFLEEASNEGVVLAVDISSSPPFEPRHLAVELARLSRWPAVAVIVLDANTSAGIELRLAARNAIFAERHAPDSSASAQLWAHIAWCEIDASGRYAPSPRDMPIIVYRQPSQHTTIEEGRRQCDLLQADLAPLGDFAGYFT